MDEYASIRLVLLCVMAARLPTVIVIAASTQNSTCQSTTRLGSPSMKIRRIMAKDAAFEPTDR